MSLNSRFKPIWRTLRLFSAQFSSKTPPGLKFFPTFITQQEQYLLINSSLDLLEHIHHFRHNGGGDIVKTTKSLSQQHNLTSDEYFERVEVTDNDIQQRKRRAQYFDSYGGRGHQLSYFMNNNNIPSFVVGNLISKLTQLTSVKELTDDISTLNWMFTFNAYSCTANNGSIAGFPYHVDSCFNGDVTAILTLMRPAMVELRPLQVKPNGPDPRSSCEEKKTHCSDFQGKSNGAPSCCLELTPGSLLVLGGESRWKWEHRVIPSTTESGEVIEKEAGRTNAKDEDRRCQDGRVVQRMSLVLGCRAKS